MNYQDKPMPLASLPDNWSAVNDREVLPWRMSRADAAAVVGADVNPLLFAGEVADFYR